MPIIAKYSEHFDWMKLLVTVETLTNISNLPSPLRDSEKSVVSFELQCGKFLIIHERNKNILE